MTHPTGGRHQHQCTGRVALLVTMASLQRKVAITDLDMSSRNRLTKSCPTANCGG